ncbi:MAG: TAT-variant-translocated molybdopterin oxidoreductase [Coraliomargaritaceae bacterium]
MEEKSQEHGAKYWKSLDDLAETPAFKEWVEKEFPSGASELEGVGRRNFMKIMAASFGLAGLGMTGCRRPKQHILPYAEQPENLIPGVANFYCSSVPGLTANTPVIVESHQGRPTKIEGNPSYKAFGGATTIYDQASILDLYDPDRSTASNFNNSKVPAYQVKDFLVSLKDTNTDSKGAGLAILAEPSASPSRIALKKAFEARYPKATWTEYTPSQYLNSREAAQSVFGRSVKSSVDFSQAKRILSIDSDFLSEGDDALAKSRGFTAKRKILNKSEVSKMNRLYSVESNLTTTGSMADHRLRLSVSQMPAFLAKLGIELINLSNSGGELLSQLSSIASTCEIEDKWVKECAADLYNSKGHSVILLGDHLSVETQALGFYLNQILSAPLTLLEHADSASDLSISNLADSINTGSVKTLIILGGNPVFDAPADLKWAKLLNKVDTTVHLSYSYNETSAESDYHIAQSHYLETWSDGRTSEGHLVPVQPLIEPLFDTFDELSLLSSIIYDAPVENYAIVKDTFTNLGGTDFNQFLKQGILDSISYSSYTGTVDISALAQLLNQASTQKVNLGLSNLELRFIPSFHAFDGRYANNGWMMECPDPITKLTWDNALLISPRLAKELESAYGVSIFATSTSMNEEGAFFKSAKGELQKNSSVFKRGKESAVIAQIKVGNNQLEIPMHVVPGLANYTVILPYGMGRQLVGRVGENVGINTYGLRTSDGMGFITGVELKATEKRFFLANTQEHWSMEGRAIVREGTVDYYKKNPDFVNQMGVESHAPANYGFKDKASLADKSQNQYRGNSAYVHPKFNEPDPNVKVWKGKEELYPNNQQWGMTIDLNTCTGCSACVVACQSENNIPIVGKDQVLRGREMHWIRLDRYFSAEKYKASEVPEDVQVSFMGMTCAHCENAPCESVCPVNATVHDKEGLNTMAYNRCVGTRYCANNCPYKVRRFNFFDWNKREIGEFYKGPLGPVEEPELEKMRANPDVTVRMRGVMEKCTYCVQRIQAAKINQKSIAGASNDTAVPDGTIKTACQQVCPNDSISFGDISDPNSEVSMMKASDRNYSVLGYLNVRPRTTYLARLRNPNKLMPDYYKKPYAYKAYKDRYGSSQATSGDHSHSNSHYDESHSAH